VITSRSSCRSGCSWARVWSRCHFN
jgi:hypothetical protein